MLKRGVPKRIKDRSYKNLIIYVQNLKNATIQPIEIELPAFKEGVSGYYAPMNPSIQKSDDGYNLVCRTVNYQKRKKE